MDPIRGMGHFKTSSKRFACTDEETPVKQPVLKLRIITEQSEIQVQYPLRVSEGATHASKSTLSTECLTYNGREQLVIKNELQARKNDFLFPNFLFLTDGIYTECVIGKMKGDFMEHVGGNI